MRQSREAKADTREAIVAAASRMLRERGIDRTSVADVMQAASKTHGGFYRHFDTKDALLSTALSAAFGQMTRYLEAGLSETGSMPVLPAFADHYLSDAMVANVGDGCPVAALSGEVARSSGEIRQGFGVGVRGFIDTLAAALDGAPEDRQRRAAQAFAMAAGAVMIARASDAETAAEVLAAARAGVAAI
ncbi:TetR/AcrR family transcriptional regulator [Sphingomonas sp. SUN019]|uniref:TetR/AcrR family transcriptional regulator n=1 Tax=Sphingomonas sp. SUN019 TaxID=2937788 RepID=UPI002164E811|nr:TetR/AcrR family transcriptional regulator [Sphingomonas sp. SUN019]UVO49668.1 TetR/AcrR family transcriptional regulator [Sphingomonas sp. SUN019]